MIPWHFLLKGLVIFLMFIGSLYLNAQQSSLVYLNETGSLEYVSYANTGEFDTIHVIPDFSYAGYRGGGVAIPHIPTVRTLNAISGDNRHIIQDAIDQVSAMQVDANGFRGAILLKTGLYEISGPLYIKESGIILRGEGQNFADSLGTQLVATASFQHNLIQFVGDESPPASSLPPLDTITVPKRQIIGNDTIDGNLWLTANVLSAIENTIFNSGEVTFWMYANNDEFSAYHSKENVHAPYVSITFTPQNQSSDSVINVFPVDDAFVRAGENGSVNYGSSSLLEMKNQGFNNDFSREAFLKFELPEIDGELVSAKLNLWCSNAGNDADQEHYITQIQDNDWDEETITYYSRPSTGFSSTRILSNIIPVGGTTFEIEGSANFRVGDKIKVVRTPNQFWIDDLQMGQYGWMPDDYMVGYERQITEINGNFITVDIPMVQAFDSIYGGGEIEKANYSNRIENCGVENMLITSLFSGEEDEDHGWTAVELKNTANCWVANVTAQFFGYSCVSLNDAGYTTIQDCAMLNPKSITDGSRKYSFYIGKGTCNLIQRCYTRGGRHDFVTGARVAGPNVFLDCVAEQTLNDIGPHHRYATGILFDNIRGGQMRVQNRMDMGSGHGWAGAQTMFWNLEAMDFDIKVESPKGAMNWGIGCSAAVKDGSGYWESWGEKVVPRSLYIQQLKDRLGDEALDNVIIGFQNSDTILQQLEIWAGLGEIELALRRPYRTMEVPGKIEFENFDVGQAGDTYYDKSPGNSGQSVRYSDVDIYTSSKSYVANTDFNEWMEYSVIAVSGSYPLKVRYSATDTEQKIVLFINDELLDTLHLEQTNDSVDFQTLVFNADVRVAGKAVIRMETLGDQIYLDWFEFIQPDGIGSLGENPPQIKIYPNPYFGQLNVESEEFIKEISVYSYLGHLLKSKEVLNSKRVNLTLNDLPGGLYIVQAIDAQNRRAFAKVLVN